jgi:hypothetical protein
MHEEDLVLAPPVALSKPNEVTGSISCRSIQLPAQSAAFGIFHTDLSMAQLPHEPLKRVRFVRAGE